MFSTNLFPHKRVIQLHVWCSKNWTNYKYRITAHIMINLQVDALLINTVRNINIDVVVMMQKVPVLTKKSNHGNNGIAIQK